MSTIFDTHAHLNFNAFDKDRDEIIKKCLESDVRVINVGTNYETSKKAVEIADTHPDGIWAAVGFHPINLDTGIIKNKVDDSEGGHFEKEFNYEKYKALALNKRTVAIGEIGLDYYYRPKTNKKVDEFKGAQKSIFLKQLDLAGELNLPLIIHCRMAHEDLLEILASCKSFKLRGVIHCFTGSPEQAKRYLDMGFHIGLNGIIFKLDLEEAIKNIPPERILLETDCPYLTPPGFSEDRNNPLGVKYVLEKVAKIKNINAETLSEITTRNARELFKI